MSNPVIAQAPKLHSRLLCLLVLFCATNCLAQRLTPLSQPPDWSRLDRFQQTISRSEFADLLNTVYAPNNAGGQWIKLEPADAVIQENATEKFILKFAANPGATVLPPRYWKAAETFGPDPRQPLSGVSIAIDPGHLGGGWAKMEELGLRIWVQKLPWFDRRPARSQAFGPTTSLRRRLNRCAEGVLQTCFHLTMDRLTRIARIQCLGRPNGCSIESMRSMRAPEL
jgi:hypothetical protein